MRIAYKDAQVRDAVGERVQTKTQSKSNNTSRPPSSKICTKPWNEPGEAGFRSEFGGEREEDARAQQMTEPEGEGRSGRARERVRTPRDGYPRESGEGGYPRGARPGGARGGSPEEGLGVPRARGARGAVRCGGGAGGACVAGVVKRL